MTRENLIETILKIDEEVLDNCIFQDEDFLHELHLQPLDILENLCGEMQQLSDKFQSDIASIQRINKEWEFDDETICPSFSIDVFYRACFFRCSEIISKYISIN